MDLAWRPESEYELYAAFWRRLVEVNQLDGVLIKRLVQRFLTGATYPWRDRDFREAGGDESAIRRLERAGWLRVVFGPIDVQFEIAHDRLLNWAVAVVLVGDLHAGQVTIEQLGKNLCGFLSGQTTIGSQHLGFVPMDTLWMMVRDDSLRERAPDLLAALEHGFGQTEALYTELVPTLGPPVADALYHRLQAATDNGWLRPAHPE